MIDLPRLIVRRFSSLYLKVIENISSLSIEGEDYYLISLEGYKRGEHNLIIPFRHVAKADAPVLGTLFGQVLPEKHGKDSRYFWIRFLFGDMVLDWAGAGARWLFPRIGALPVSNKRVIKEQIEAIRETVLSGQYPLSMAPEAQVNYYNEKAGDLTGGLTHFIRWNQKDERPVVIQPIAVRYLYQDDSLKERIIAGFKGLGIDLDEKLAPVQLMDEAIIRLLRFLVDYLSGDRSFSDRIFDCAEELLPVVHELLISSAESAYSIGSGRRLLDKVLSFRNYVFEDLRVSGMTVPAMMKSIEKTWSDPEKMTDLQRLYQHQQLLDVLTNFDPSYHQSGDGNRAAEQALFILDIINRLKGGDVNSRYFPRKTRAVASFGEPLLIEPDGDPNLWKECFFKRLSLK